MKSLIFNRKSGEWASPFLFRPLGAVGVSPPCPPEENSDFARFPVFVCFSLRAQIQEVSVSRELRRILSCNVPIKKRLPLLPWQWTAGTSGKPFPAAPAEDSRNFRKAFSPPLQQRAAATPERHFPHRSIRKQRQRPESIFPAAPSENNGDIRRVFSSPFHQKTEAIFYEYILFLKVF